jgi:hypothetical protein
MTGLRIHEFYVHDDQIGPFARIKVERGDDAESPIVFKGSWKDSKGDPLTLIPSVVIVPVYNKIRLSFTDIYAWARRFHRAFLNVNFFRARKLEWDIYLTSTNDYKTTISEEDVGTDSLEALRSRQHPRFIWRVRLQVDGKPAIELLADATDISHSFPIYGLLWRDKPLMERSVIGAINDASLRDLLTRTLTEQFFEFLKRGADHVVFLRPRSRHRDVY